MISRFTAGFIPYLGIEMYFARRKCVTGCYEHLSSVVVLTKEQLTRPLLKV